MRDGVFYIMGLRDGKAGNLAQSNRNWTATQRRLYSDGYHKGNGSRKVY